MFKLVRLVILFAVVAGGVFGFVYALVVSARRRRQEFLEREREKVLERLRALAEARARGEIGDREADELTWQVYLEARDKGVDLAREELPDEQAEMERERAD